MARRRSLAGRVLDAITFPLRAVTLFHRDRLGLSSLASERFDWVAREVRGRCLDIGCGPGNRFVQEYCGGNGVGLDVYPYAGLTEQNVVPSLTHFPCADSSFETVTFIANLNHVPESKRDVELTEAFRVLVEGGRIVVTMGTPWVEVAVHRVVWLYDSVLGTHVDMDSERGMHEEEAYFLTEREIRTLLERAGFADVRKKRFSTQWFLNALYVGVKR